tara:strand:- start:887 stop:1156 length:270 start_codon:yes stop_codon:yes gene_type:complete
MTAEEGHRANEAHKMSHEDILKWLMEWGRRPISKAYLLTTWAYKINWKMAMDDGFLQNEVGDYSKMQLTEKAIESLSKKQVKNDKRTNT